MNVCTVELHCSEPFEEEKIGEAREESITVVKTLKQIYSVAVTSVVRR